MKTVAQGELCFYIKENGQPCASLLFDLSGERDPAKRVSFVLLGGSLQRSILIRLLVQRISLWPGLIHQDVGKLEACF